MRCGFPLVSLSVLLLVGCSESEPAAAPGDPAAVEAVEAHAQALLRADWRAAYRLLDPTVAGRLPYERFAKRWAGRQKAGEMPKEVQVVKSESVGDGEVVVELEVRVLTGSGEVVPVPPRRKVAARRAGAGWSVASADILGVQ